MIDSPSYHRLKIILTGGGTAGHVWPLLEIAKALKSHQLLYLGSTGPEVKLVPQRGIEFKKILSGKWRRYFSFKNIIDLIKITFGVIETWWVVKSFQPDIILSKGGYVSLPVVLVARYLKIPLVIHESDIIMGVANRIAVNFAQKIFLGFPPENYQNLPWDKVIYTGIPVREDFRQSFSKKSNRPNIFITGGSQGAHFINQITSEILPSLLEKATVVHLSGERDFSMLSKIKNPNYQVMPFVEDEMPELIGQADLIIARAGATTLAELAAAGKPSILIPLATAAGNHQVINAEIFQKAQAAVVLSQDQITPSSLLSIILRMLEDQETLKLMGLQAKRFDQKNSAQEIASIIEELGLKARTLKLKKN